MFRIIIIIFTIFGCKLIAASGALTQKLPTLTTEKPANKKLISLNFQEIKVRAVLQVLAEFTGMNMVVSDKVKGSITLRLFEVPWEQALNIILTTRSLSKRYIGNVMLIAPAEELIDREKKEFDIQSDLNNLIPLRSALLQINYAKAQEVANLIKEQNTSLLSARGSLNVDSRTNALWIQDTGLQIKKIKKLLAHIDVPVKQVLIEARIVNVAKDFAKDLGIRFGISNPKHLVGSLRRGAGLPNLNEVGSNTVPLAERLNLDLIAAPLSAPPASIGIALAKLGGDILLDLELSALESEGKGEIISSPRLITTNQQTAIIESGEEIPYQEATLSGATAVAFKKAVLSLKVTPQITPDAKIMMDLHINQDIPSVKIFNGVPSILTKEIHTTVLVDNGETIVLGGIYKQDKNNAINRVPFLGELPLIGALFRNRSVITRNEELLIFITPRIITTNLPESSLKLQGKTVAGRVELKKFGRSVSLATKLGKRIKER